MSAVVQDLVRVAVEQFGVTSAELRRSSDLQVEVASAAGLEVDVRAEQWRAVAEGLDRAHERAAAAHAGRSGISRCRSCGAPFRWVTTEAGKPMSLDPLPRPMGNVIMVPRGQSRLVAKVVSKSALPVKGAPAYQTHFVSCPDAASMRRPRRGSGAGRGRKPAAAGPPCQVCRRPMNAAYALASGEDTHPTCDPNPEAPATSSGPQLTLLTGGES